MHLLVNFGYGAYHILYVLYSVLVLAKRLQDPFFKGSYLTISFHPSNSGTVLLQDIVKEPVGWGIQFPFDLCVIAPVNLFWLFLQ